MFSIPEWGTVTLLEVMWTLIASFGAGLSYAGLKDAILDRKDVANDILALGHAAGDSVLQVIANGQVRQERMMLLMQIIFFAVGCAAMILPGHVTPTRVILSLLLTGGESLVAWNALQNRFDRKKILTWTSKVSVNLPQSEPREGEDE